MPASLSHVCCLGGDPSDPAGGREAGGGAVDLEEGRKEENMDMAWHLALFLPHPSLPHPLCPLPHLPPSHAWSGGYSLIINFSSLLHSIRQGRLEGQDFGGAGDRAWELTPHSPSPSPSLPSTSTSTSPQPHPLPLLPYRTDWRGEGDGEGGGEEGEEGRGRRKNGDTWPGIQ